MPLDILPSAEPQDVLTGALRRHFAFDRFRAGQREIIEAVLAGRSTVAILPTGGGKSLCYQLPALLSAGVTIVVSPLIALMKDQVDQLNRLGLPATVINSTVPRDQQRSRLEQAIAGRIKLLYLAPERFQNDEFRTGCPSFAIRDSSFAIHWSLVIICRGFSRTSPADKATKN